MNIFQIYWQASNFENLLIKHWEGEYFIFNPLSGDTHLLNETTMFILKSLNEQSMTIDEFIQTFSTDEQTINEMKQHLPFIIQNIAQMGLIEPLSIK